MVRFFNRGSLTWAFVLGMSLMVPPGTAAAQSGKGVRPSQITGSDPFSGPAKKDVQDLIFLGPSRPVLLRFDVQIDGNSVEGVWQDLVKDLFAYLDRDSDGTLNQEEAGRIPPAAMIFAAAPNLFAGVNPVSLASVDADRDNKVTLAELRTYYRQSGGRALQLQSGPGRAPPADPFFSRLDLNKDGQLSKEEITDAAATLLKLDQDRDEVVTRQELGLPANPVAPPKKSPPPPKKPAPPALLTTAFVPVVPGESPPRWTAELWRRFGPAGQVPGDKKLTRADLGLDQETFHRLDKNQDGQLDAEELAQFPDRPGDVEFVVRLDQAEDKCLLDLAPAGGLTAQVRKTNTGSLVLDLGDAQISLALAPRTTQPAFNPAANRQFYAQQFKTVDVDKNGYLTSLEAQRLGFRGNLFRLADHDDDGKLYEKELLAFLDTYFELQARARACRVFFAVADQGRGLFPLLDANCDGRLGLREIRSLPAQLRALDRNGDGQLSSTEIPQLYQLTCSQGQPAPAIPPATLTPTTTVVGPLWFRKMDRNGDGDVSPREFLGTPEQFRQLDTDGDGLISSQEAEQAEAVFRNRKIP